MDFENRVTWSNDYTICSLVSERPITPGRLHLKRRHMLDGMHAHHRYPKNEPWIIMGHYESGLRRLEEVHMTVVFLEGFSDI